MKFDENGALIESEIEGLTLHRRGKVRDVYDLGDKLLIVATDRISAFDVVMPNGIPDKGKVLTGLSLFWFDLLKNIPNHLITDKINQDNLKKHASVLSCRSMIVKKTKVLPVECIVRGYLVGSGWKDYCREKKVCGITLRDGYKQAEKLDKPLFTPSTKAEQGEHDQNISYEDMSKIIGEEKAKKVKQMALDAYKTAADYAETKGIIIADTKFEFGETENGEIILIDEVLTPDSSRFWPLSEYKPGSNPPSFDKQFVRDYLETISWNKTPPAPVLPQKIISKTRERYLKAYKILTGKDLL